MAYKRIWIEPGCISCNLCEDICAEVFEVPGGSTSRVRKGWKKATRDGEVIDRVQEAADSCPVEVIQVERKT